MATAIATESATIFPIAIHCEYIYSNHNDTDIVSDIIVIAIYEYFDSDSDSIGDTTVVAICSDT